MLLGYPDIAAAGDAVPAILPHQPIALEGIDDKLVSFERRKQPATRDALHELPEGGAWLMVQIGGDTPEEADAAADAMLIALGPHADDGPTSHFFDDPADEKRAVGGPRVRARRHRARARRSATPGRAGRTRRSPRTGSATTCATCSGSTDEYGYEQASLYGHFGQGCVHTRIPFDLRTADGVARLPLVHRARRRPGRLLRRLVLRRARRRAGPRRAAAEDVRRPS